MMEYFTDDEIRCKCGCGVVRYNEYFRMVLNRVREDCGFPFIINSWYRCPNHPIEAAKRTPGEHSTGACADIRCNSAQAYTIVEMALYHGIRRIGIQQQSGLASEQRFVHLGTASGFPAPVIWTY